MPRPLLVLINLSVCLSQVGNVLFLAGNPSETISGRAFRKGVLQNEPRWDRLRRFIDALFFWERDGHCRATHERDVAQARRILALDRDP